MKAAGAMEVASIEPQERCTMQFVLIAGNKPRFHSSRTDQGRFTAASAIRNTGLQGLPEDIKLIGSSSIDLLDTNTYPHLAENNAGQFHAHENFLLVSVLLSQKTDSDGHGRGSKSYAHLKQIVGESKSINPKVQR